MRCFRRHRDGSSIDLAAATAVTSAPRPWPCPPWPRAVLVTVLMLLVPMLSCRLAAVEPMPSFAELEPLFQRALTPSAAADLDQYGDLPLYRIRATYRPAQRTMDGKMRIEFRNTSGGALTELAFYAFANAPSFHGAGLSLSHIAIDGREARQQRAVEDRADIIVSLPRAIVDGQTCVFNCDFQCSLSGTGGDNGLDAQADGVACLYAWYPVLAGRRDGAWQVHPIDDLCDPSVLEMAHVLLELTVPDDVQLASGGSIVGVRHGSAGGRIVTIAAPFTRDLALVLAPQLVEQTLLHGPTTISSWSLPANRGTSDVVLSTAASALDCFSAFGSLPYAHLTAVQVALAPQVGGMESSGLILINGNLQVPGIPALTSAPAAAAKAFIYDLVVSHEVAHQWFYGLVGSDAFRCPWLDESLADWSDCYFCEQRAPAAFSRLPWQMDLSDCSSDEVIGADATISVGAYHGGIEQYAGVVYSRGALMYQALRMRLGPDRFLGFLQEWVSRHRYQVVGQADWAQAIIRALGPEEGSAFVAKWLQGRGLRAEDLSGVAHVAPPLPASLAPDGR